MDPITAGIFILLGIIVFGAVLMIAMWNSVKRTYAETNHIVPLDMRLGFFAIGCCTLIVPLYIMVHLILTY